MKHKLAALTLIAGLIANGTIYPATAIITDTNSTTATLEMTNGHLYQVDKEDNEKGDIISLIMFNNGTEDITDDIILTYRYSGTLEHFEMIELEQIERR